MPMIMPTPGEHGRRRRPSPSSKRGTMTWSMTHCTAMLDATVHSGEDGGAADGDGERARVQARPSAREHPRRPRGRASNRRVERLGDPRTTFLPAAPRRRRRSRDPGVATAGSVACGAVDPVDLALLVAAASCSGCSSPPTATTRCSAAVGSPARPAGSVDRACAGRRPGPPRRRHRDRRRAAVRRRAADAVRRRRDDRRDARRQLAAHRTTGSSSSRTGLGVHRRRSPSSPGPSPRSAPASASLDHAIGLDWTAWDGWIGAVIAGVLGVGGGRRPARRLLPAAAERGRDVTATAAPPTPPRRRADRRAAARGATSVLAVVVLFAAFWIWALFFASKESINRIGDGAWAERAAGDLRGGRRRARGRSPTSASVDDDDPAMLAERGDIVDRATDIVERDARRRRRRRARPTPRAPSSCRCGRPTTAPTSPTAARSADELRAGRQRAVRRDRRRRHPDQRQDQPLRRRQRMPACAPPDRPRLTRCRRRQLVDVRLVRRRRDRHPDVHGVT